MPLAPSPPFKPAQPVEAKKGKPMDATVTQLRTPTPGPVPASSLLPLAEHNLSQGMTPGWVQERGWPEMADTMTFLALDAQTRATVAEILEASR